MAKRKLWKMEILSLFLDVCAFAGRAHCVRKMAAVVTTDWLHRNSGLKNLVILDIRSVDAYKEGHIPNAINEPFLVPVSKWIVLRGDLIMEVPEKEALFETIGNLGIRSDSWVVIVTAPNPGEPPYYGLANATRVADTLLYAGVRNVAVLDGGYPKWVAEGRATATSASEVNPTTYQGETNEAMFVSMDYVQSQLRKARIIDARDAEVYFGVAVEPFANKTGHIPNAGSLPAPWIWNRNEDGTYTYKPEETLHAMAVGVIGKFRGKEIIVYCGVGGYAGAWWFVLTQMLGYKKVRFYDGSAQEWVKEYDMVPYQWE
ncbi:MAG: sulfurtransferase [Deltaproteobacteria bacterium]|nr:sulfurtransferase [Deltaproteobacteria bacterium]